MTLDAIRLVGLRHPRLSLTIGALLALASALALTRIDPITDVSDMIQTPSARTFARASKLFALDERAFLLIESDSPGREDSLRRFARELETRLAGKQGIASVEHGVSSSSEDAVARAAVPWGPLFFGPGELATLDRLLTPAGIDAAVARQASRLALMGMGDAETWAARDPLELGQALARRLETLTGGYRFAKGSRDFISEDGRALLLIVTTTGGTAADSRAIVGAVEEATSALGREPWASGLTWCGTGGAFFEEETERQIRGDLIGSLTSSLLVCALILAIGFRLWRPDWLFVLTAPTLWGTLVGLGLFALVKPRFFAMSAGCAAILVGLGIDYVIHVTCGSLDLRSRGESPVAAVEGGIRQTWTGLLGSTFTSVAAFGAFGLSEQVFLREMGLVAALGFLTCFAGTLLLLPPILVRFLEGRGNRTATEGPRTLGVRSSVAFSTRHPRVVLMLSGLLALAAVAWLALRPVTLEDDLRNVYARDSKPLAAQARIAAAFGGSREPVLVLVEGSSEDDVAASCARLEGPLATLEREGLLVARESLAPFVPAREDQERVLALLATKDGPALARSFRVALDRAGFDPAPFEPYARGLEAACAARQPLTVGRLRELGFGPLLRPFVAPTPGGAAGLVVVFPRSDLWRGADRDALVPRLEQALALARTKGSLSSLYLTSDESARQVSDDFRRVTLASLVAVTAIVALQFRRPARVALVLLPSALGLLSTAALFSLLGYKLNLMNLGVLPMLAGVGVDDGIYPVDRFFSRPAEGVAAAFRFRGGAMVLSMTTTMVSFGSLAFSRNRGMASVGFLTFVGLGLCLVASITTLPAVLELLARTKKKVEP